MKGPFLDLGEEGKRKHKPIGRRKQKSTNLEGEEGVGRFYIGMSVKTS